MPHAPRLSLSDARTAEACCEDAGLVMVRLGQILPLLIEAVETDRGWVQDFAAEKVAISTDLYELLRFYAHRRESVA